jgi:hypothetical protein
MVAFDIKDTCILLVAFPLLAYMLGVIRRPSFWVAAVLAALGMILDI